MLPKKESDALKVREESKQDKTDVPSDDLLQEIKRTAAGTHSLFLLQINFSLF